MDTIYSSPDISRINRESFGSPDQATTETGFSHSVSYHDFFHGYAERKVILANGRTRIVRVYTDPWIVADTQGRDQVINRIRYLLYYAVSVSMYLLVLATRSSVSSSKAVAVPGLLAAPVYLLLGAAILHYCLRRFRMTWYSFHSANRKLTRYCTAGSVLNILTAAVMAGYVIMHHPIDSALCLIQAAGLLTAGLLLLRMKVREGKQKYHTEDNETVAQPDSFVIR